MKIILSRKGFDSGTGGVPSPIAPDGRMTSLPIPGGARMRYAQMQSPLGPMSRLVADLTKGRIRPTAPAHLDPDLWTDAIPRHEGWRPSLGQVGAAQSHLASQGVTVGDVFLFFGWFRSAQANGQGTWGYVPGAPHRHVLFGYLQIGEVLPLGAHPDTQQVLACRPWLRGHPHITGARADNNTLLIASDRLTLDGRDTGLPGASAFPVFNPSLVLTAPGHSRSVWKLPEWFSPRAGHAGLSYHTAPDRWSRSPDGSALLKSVAKGQEFVWDATGMPQALEWVEALARQASPTSPMRPVPRTHKLRR